jgi:hypothetical protein
MSYDWNFSKRLDALNLKKPIYENIVLGNSLAMDGINSTLLSSDSNSTYNLSIGGASLKTNYIQLQDYLEIANKKPKRVLLGIASYRNLFFKEEIHPIVQFTNSNYKYNLTDIPMIKFKWIFKELIKKIISIEHRDARVVQGQLRISKKTPDKTQQNSIIKGIPFEKYKKSKSLMDIVTLCNQNNIELILIEMPGFRNTRNNEDVGPYVINYNQTTAVKLYNFNGSDIDLILDPQIDWLGNSHLNDIGARKFTKFISHYIFK